MEKERLDGLSPRGVLEACIRGLESEKGSSKADNSETETLCLNSKGVSNWRRFFTLWKRGSIKRLPSFPPLAMSKVSKRKSKSAIENVHPGLNPFIDTNSYNFEQTWKNFTFSELKTATNNFGRENMIGRGGYAEVYKGRLQDGQLVAIKRLTRGTLEEQTAGFLSELGIIAHVNHPNTAKLIGCGVEGGMHLVFQLSPLGSLGSLLHGSKERLDWGIRFVILALQSGYQINALITMYQNLKAHLGLQSLCLITMTVGNLVDPSIGDAYDPEEMDRVVLTASLCIEQSPILRPRMNQASPNFRKDHRATKKIDRIVILLRGDEYSPECAKECQKLSHGRTYSEELLDAEEYNSTKCLSDLNRHKQVALGS
ncbi:hypothetical protein L1049_020169 [Liquidambar formosana]|uniref:Protein kinase domain-containing protein n=1 Tax=Liquidambar formosana TaxID=63359 RepID=A0AAP0X768_LIQFO